MAREAIRAGAAEAAAAAWSDSGKVDLDRGLEYAVATWREVDGRAAARMEALYSTVAGADLDLDGFDKAPRRPASPPHPVGTAASRLGTGPNSGPLVLTLTRVIRVNSNWGSALQAVRSPQESKRFADMGDALATCKWRPLPASRPTNKAVRTRQEAEHATGRLQGTPPQMCDGRAATTSAVGRRRRVQLPDKIRRMDPSPADDRLSLASVIPPPPSCPSLWRRRRRRRMIQR